MDAFNKAWGVVKAEYMATMCDSCEAIYPQKMEGHECLGECKGTIKNLYEYEDGSADFE